MCWREREGGWRRGQEGSGEGLGDSGREKGR